MIRRTFDATFLNEVANHPEVRPHLGVDGVVDVSAAVSNPDNYALVSDAGGFLVIQHEPGVYEVHSQFLPGCGTEPIRAMRAAIEYMFTRTDCAEIVSQVPDSNKPAKGLALAGGLMERFRREDTPRGPTSFVSLTLMGWAMRSAYLEHHGEEFHDCIERAKAVAGSELPTHPHDPAHERAVGAALLMVKAGNTAKAIGFYNRWARMAGYVPLTLISINPPVVDAGDAVIGLTNGNLEVLLCR